MISEDFLNELKTRCDIDYIVSLYVALKKAGKNKIGKCPFHSEKTASMVVYQDTQSFYCFGCGAGGDVITFIKKIENLDYLESVKFLAQKVGMNIPEDNADDKKYIVKNKVIQINKIAARFFYNNLIDNDNQLVRQYLLNRKISNRYIKKFGLGFAKNQWTSVTDYLKQLGYTEEEMLASNLVVRGKNNKLYDMFRNRLIFPIIDIKGNVIAFGGRILDDKVKAAKYLNSADTVLFKKSNNLYAMNFAKNTKEDYIILSEGYMDVIAMYQAGCNNVVATLGTALTSQQARLLSTYTSRIILSYDSDEAGQKATNKAVNILSEVGISTKILNIKNAKDPDEYIRKFGQHRFLLLLNSSENIFDFKIERLKKQYDLSDLQEKVNFLKECVKVISIISNPIEREVYTSKIAYEFNINKEVFTNQVKKCIKNRITRNKVTKNKMLNTVGYEFKKNNHHNNVKFIIAENKIITILLKNPDFYELISNELGENDFYDEVNRKIFVVIMSRVANNLSIDITNLSNVVDEESVIKIAYLIADNFNLKYNKDDLLGYISVLKSRKKSDGIDISNMDEKEFKAYFDNIIKNKRCY